MILAELIVDCNDKAFKEGKRINSLWWYKVVRKAEKLIGRETLFTVILKRNFHNPKAVKYVKIYKETE